MDEYTALKFERAALITIDTRQCTLDGGAFEIPGTSAAVPLPTIVKAFGKAERPIIHVICQYHPDGSNAELCRHKRLAAGAQLTVVGSFGRMPAMQRSCWIPMETTLRPFVKNLRSARRAQLESNVYPCTAAILSWQRPSAHFPTGKSWRRLLGALGTVLDTPSNRRASGVEGRRLVLVPRFPNCTWR